PRLAEPACRDLWLLAALAAEWVKELLPTHRVRSSFDGRAQDHRSAVPERRLARARAQPNYRGVRTPRDPECSHKVRLRPRSCDQREFRDAAGTPRPTMERRHHEHRAGSRTAEFASLAGDRGRHRLAPRLATT